MSDPQTACRSCGARQLELVLSLGRMPLANAFPAKEDGIYPERVYPLELAFCHACGLVQILETVPPEQLFREYLYFSSYSDTLVEHARGLAERLTAERRLGREDLVVELASNDGYLLQHFVAMGIPVLGIEPARNVAKVAQERGIPTLVEFFDAGLAKRLVSQGVRADVIIANNVLAHVAALNGFVEGIGLLLKDGGLAVIEVPYVKDMIDRCEFDTIYHEHLCYYSLASLTPLFYRHGLVVADIERIPIHGGSLRVFVGPEAAVRPSERVGMLLEREQAWGAASADNYRAFGTRVAGLKRSLQHLLDMLRRQGKRVAGYGAAAKGTVLLNYCGIGPDVIDFVADRSPYKQGRYIPGVRVPIVPPETIAASRPDYLLLLAWNFAEEIMQQQKLFRDRGGQFIIPVPAPRVI